MSKIKPQDHPDYVGGWVWTKLELDWINERIGTLEAALFQAQEAAKDLEAKLTKTEGWLNEAMWNYGELKREQLANQEKTSSSPVEDWEAIAADQAMTIALLKSEATPPAQRQWVGLEEEEIKHAPHHMVEGAYHHSFKQGAEWADAKLREKNGGAA
jgi:hypothetical protein